MTMKIIHITDNHLVTPGELLDGLNPVDSLDACIRAVNSYQSDAAFCVFSGDIANAGGTDAYQAFIKSVNNLNLKYYVMMGNHDDRATFVENFPETPCDTNGFVQQVIKTDLGHFLLLDTIAEKASWGEYCEKRSQWLREQLQDAGGKPVYIFMHHPPFDIGMPSMDRLKLLDITHFEAAISGFSNIRHIFLGHVHRTIYGSWRNIPYSILPGTNHQVAFNLDVLSPVPHSLEPPAYGMVLIEKDQVTVHPHFYSQNKDLPLPDYAKWVEKTKEIS
jgi:3',5'-cyclic-AMP phosphodiesterase